MKLLKICIAIIVALLFNQCADHEPVEIDSLSIEAVKSYFNNLPQNQSANGRKSKIDILWEYGVYKQLEDGELDAITFPIKPEENLYVSGGEDVRRFPVESTAIAFAYKEDGEIKLELLQMVPTTNSDPFTGFVTINEWGEEVKQMLYFQDGELQKEPYDPNGRLDGLVCSTVHHWYCTQSGDEKSDADDCTYEGYTTSCSYSNDQSDGIYDALLPGLEKVGGGNGGNSSSDNGEYCPSPLDPDIMVPCNENTCGPGMEPDGEGGCVSVQEKPCPGDPFRFMEISTYNSGKNANRFGCVRTGDTSCSGKQKHGGIDLMGSEGTPIVSISGGTVYYVQEGHSSFGNWIVIQNGDLFYAYAHLRDVPTLEVGDEVSNGVSLLGYIGDTGNAPDGEYHLHLEVKQRSNSTDNYNSANAIDPEYSLGTKFDSNGNKIFNENCK